MLFLSILLNVGPEQHRGRVHASHPAIHGLNLTTGKEISYFRESVVYNGTASASSERHLKFNGLL